MCNVNEFGAFGSYMEITEITPSQVRIEAVAEEWNLAKVCDTERHLLHVACMRTREHLLVTSGDAFSQFIGHCVSTVAAVATSATFICSLCRPIYRIARVIRTDG
jgi:hypothetical protein